MNGCTEQYCCETALYSLSILVYAYNILIDRAVGTPGYVGEAVDDLNANDFFNLNVNKNYEAAWCRRLLLTDGDT